MSNFDRGFPRPVKMNIHSLLMYEDGYRDPRKVVVKPLDTDQDGVPDDPLILDQVILNFEDEPQRVVFRKIRDFDGYEYMALWRGNFVDLSHHTATDYFQAFEQGQGQTWTVRGRAHSESAALERTVRLSDADLIILPRGIVKFAQDAAPGVTSFEGFVQARVTDEVQASQWRGRVLRINGAYWKISVDSSFTVSLESTQDYADRPGRSFTLNQLMPVQNPLHFRWKHYAPRQNRIDPSISNVIDMFVITEGYFREVKQWKASNLSAEALPRPPTSEALRVQFGNLDQFKMMSDQIVYKPGQFKLLFGRGAEPELQARFQVVKLPSVTLTDNEIKSRVIDAVEEYFQIENWDFGENFFFTELSAFIHQRLSNAISTVVIVPTKADSAFGNLFEIKSEVNELFLSTATVADVDIVSNLTETNLRVQRRDLFNPE